MKPQLLKITHDPVQSFSVRQDMKPDPNNKWHYHEELEIILFHKGAGTQFIGDSVRKFKAGDIVLIGSDLPHYLMYDQQYFFDKGQEPCTTVIYFRESLFGERFLSLPECRKIKLLLEKSARGIMLSGSPAENLAQHIRKLLSAHEMFRMTALMELLAVFAELQQTDLLSSAGFKYDKSSLEAERINAVYNHSLKNFRRKIDLNEISSETGLTPNSFCRYFKKATGKTYKEFLNDIRIGYACKLILDNKLSVKQICYECGFNNFSCFHKYFRETTGYTPQNYFKEYQRGQTKQPHWHLQSHASR